MNDISPNVSQFFERVIDEKIRKILNRKTESIHAAQVTSTSTETVYVRIIGSDTDTPVSVSNVMVNVGDQVQVRIANGVAEILGNVSDPATTYTEVNDISEVTASRVGRDLLRPAMRASELAKEAAEEAKGVAEATGQHFWRRSEDPDGDGAGTGAFVTDEDRESFLNAISQGVEPTDDRPLHNLLMNANGILIRVGKKVFSAFTRTSVTFFDGLGTAASNVAATFGLNGYQVGRTGESHQKGDYRSFKMVDKEGSDYVSFLDLREIYGEELLAVINASFVGDGEQRDFPLPVYVDRNHMDFPVFANGVEITSGFTRTSGSIRFTAPPASGTAITATYYSSDPRAKAFTFGLRALGENIGALSFACGYQVSAGNMSAAFGNFTEASGHNSFAAGQNCEASGHNSVAFGINARALAYFSFACGHTTTASEYGAAAFGSNNVASGYCSAAFGSGNLAEYSNQVVFGKYNAPTDAYLIIGDGSGPLDEDRSNVFLVTKSGSIWTANPAGTRQNLGLGSLATKSSLAASDIPDLPASKITSGALGLARGGTGTDNSTGRAARTFFAAPSSTSGAASWRFITDTDLPGTQVQTTVATVVTAGSAATISSVGFRRRCGVCQLSLAFRPSSSTASGAAVTVGTLKEGYRPKNTCFIGDARWSGTITRAGVIQVLNSAGTAINDTRTICATWVD